MKFIALLKSLVRKIPGFRQLSSSSMVIAATWYGAAILTMFRYWHWGLALLALPFLVFYLLDAGTVQNKPLRRAVSVAAGLLVLLGAAGGISEGTGSPPPSPSLPSAGSSFVLTQSPSVASPAATTPHATPRPTATPAASLAAASTATATAVPVVETPTETPTVTPTETPTETADAKAAYVAAKGSEVFHVPGCASAKKIKPENRIVFTTREEAAAAGLRPCKKCKP